MRKYLLVLGFWIMEAMGGIVAPALAEEKLILRAHSKQVITIPSLSEVEQPLTTAEGLLVQQPAPTPAIAQVTGVQLNPTERGLEVLLETAAEFPEVLTSTVDNSLITDIPNTQLRLPNGGAFRQDNPSKDIAAVEVTNLDAKSVRVIVTGKAGVPTAEVSQSPQALILSLTAPPAPAPQPTTPTTPPAAPAPEPPPVAPEPQAEEAPLDLTVTAEEEAGGYSAPNASSATRTDTPIRDIPQAIQVIPRQVIEDQQAIGVEEVIENAAGVSFLGTDDGAGLNFAIRGFEGAEVLRDGFRLFGNDTVEPEVANLERVEVLKGPASSLYGQIVPGGLINLVTKQPLSEPFYNFQFQVGNRNFLSPSLDLSGPLTEDGRLLYRLNALYRQEGSVQDYDSNFDRVFVGPTLTWRISDQTDLTVNLEYIKDDDPVENGTVAVGSGIADIPLERVINNPDDTISKDYLNVGYTLEHRFSENWQLRNQFRYILNDYEYSVLALPFDFDEATGDLFRAFTGRSAKDDLYTLYTNLQGKFNTGPVQHTLLAGVDLSRGENEFVTRFNFTSPEFFSPINIFGPDPDYFAIPKPPLNSIPISAGVSTTATTDQLGIYLQDQIDILDNLIVVAGVRYDVVDQDSSDIVTNEAFSQTDDAFTPRFGIVYQPIEPISLYANYARSFSPNLDFDAEGQPLEPQLGEGFDVGVKADIFDRLSATLAYFNITNQNVAVPDPNDPTGFGFIASGEQRSRGIDLDLTGEILPGWNIIGSYAYINAEVTEETAPNLVGNRLFGIPEHSASLWTTYEIQSGNFQGLGFGVGFNFVGEREGDLDNSFQVDSYFLANAAVFYRRDQWRVGLNIDNLFDVGYIESVNNQRFRQIYPGNPFTVRASVSVEL